MSRSCDVDPDFLDETARKIERAAVESNSILGQGSEFYGGHTGLSTVIALFAYRWAKAQEIAREETQLRSNSLRTLAGLHRTEDHEAHQNLGGYER